jgi:hypothetical protein
MIEVSYEAHGVFIVGIRVCGRRPFALDHGRLRRHVLSVGGGQSRRCGQRLIVFVELGWKRFGLRRQRLVRGLGFELGRRKCIELR